MAELLYIKEAEQVVTVAGASDKPKVGEDLSEIGVIECGSVIVEGEKIAFVGTDGDAYQYLQKRSGKVKTIEARGKILTPGLVDPHTHLVFAGSREHELAMRLKGKSYMNILQAGGGILSTTKSTRAATAEQLAYESRVRLNRFLQHGVTTVEAKSGYGLATDAELKQLRVAKQLNNEHPVDVVSTFMGAHAIPPEWKQDPNAFVKLVAEEMIPQVAAENLAEFCDVFCEEGVFTVAQSQYILEEGEKHGLKPKIHADELVSFGGAELAAKVGAVSADHLLKASPTGIKQMAEAGVIAVLLPGTAFFLMTEPANARAMIEAGVPVALSTDRNPGSSPTESLPFIMNLACLTMKMTPEEVLAAATINAAHAIDRAKDIGSIEAGKNADLVLFDAPNYQTLQYNYAVNRVDTVMKAGKIVVEGGVLLEETDNQRRSLATENRGTRPIWQK